MRSSDAEVLDPRLQPSHYMFRLCLEQRSDTVPNALHVAIIFRRHPPLNAQDVVWQQVALLLEGDKHSVLQAEFPIIGLGVREEHRIEEINNKTMVLLLPTVVMVACHICI